MARIDFRRGRLFLVKTVGYMYGWFRRLVQCFICPEAGDNYLLLNDGGVFCFSIGKRTQKLIAYSISADGSDSDKCLDDVLEKIRSSGDFICRPITVLVGGSKCFCSIHRMGNRIALDYHQVLQWLDLERTHVAFRYINGHKNTGLICYGGIARDLYAGMIARIEKAGIYIKDFLPASFLICKCRMQLTSDSSIAVELPGQVTWICGGDENPAIVDKCLKTLHERDVFDNRPGGGGEIMYYSFFANDAGTCPPAVAPVISLVYRNLRLSVPRIRFFAAAGRDRAAPFLFSLSIILKWSSLLAVGSMIPLLLLAFAMHAFRAGDDVALAVSPAEFQARDNLRGEVRDLLERLNDAGSDADPKYSYSGAIAAFCQRRPRGLILTEIKTAPGKTKERCITATGLAEEITSIFEYREYVADYIGECSLQITQAKPLGTRYGDSSGHLKPSYSFTIKMVLGGSK
jgi:hypothetical protein